MVEEQTILQTPVFVPPWLLIQKVTTVKWLHTLQNFQQQQQHCNINSLCHPSKFCLTFRKMGIVFLLCVRHGSKHCMYVFTHWILTTAQWERDIATSTHGETENSTERLTNLPQVIDSKMKKTWFAGSCRVCALNHYGLWPCHMGFMLYKVTACMLPCFS